MVTLEDNEELKKWISLCPKSIQSKALNKSKPGISYETSFIHLHVCSFIEHAQRGKIDHLGIKATLTSRGD